MCLRRSLLNFSTNPQQIRLSCPEKKPLTIKKTPPGRLCRACHGFARRRFFRAGGCCVFFPSQTTRKEKIHTAFLVARSLFFGFFTYAYEKSCLTQKKPKAPYAPLRPSGGSGTRAGFGEKKFPFLM